MALTTGIPLGTKEHCFFYTFITYIKSKGNFFKNLATEHRNSPQGCIVNPIKGVIKNLLGGI